MYVLKRRKLAFIAHPRTASRACSKTLLAAGARMVEGHHGYSGSECQRILESGGTVACVVRNMFDVMVSWWYNQNFVVATGDPLKNEVTPFDKFLHDKAYTTKHRWFQPKLYHYGLTISNQVIRYEHLEEGLRAMYLGIQVAPPTLPVIGASKRTHYRDYYTPDLRAIVEDRWGWDLKSTEYEF